MDYFKISKFTENDFTSIIESIDGRRFSMDDSKETQQNCDYVFQDALIELKLVEENLIEKKAKRDKLAELFIRNSNSKTVILASELLTEKQQREYYRILETPIKTALKKASKQLQESSESENVVKVALIINNGLSFMMPEEFEKIAMERAKNDTSGIDILLIGGCYFFSDKFDSYVIFPLKELYLNGVYRTDIVDAIRDGWNVFLNQFMTRHITDTDLIRNKEPLKDISFEIGDILYVKPPPKMGKSDFWINGRQREDSTNLNVCPPVATVIPAFDKDNYDIAKRLIEDNWHLKDDLSKYQIWLKKEIKESSTLFRPLIEIKISCNNLQARSYQELCEFSVDVFEQQLGKIIDNSRKFTKEHQSLNYILLNCIEIGIDKANDLAYINHISEYPNMEYDKTIIDGERMKFEYALVLASAYCLKVGADCVYYVRNETYKWV